MSDDEDYYQEATPQEKLKIATHFILKSPNGEVNDVVADLQKLLQSTQTHILDGDTVHRILRKYNTDQLFFASDSLANLVLVCDIGERDSSNYYDPKNKRYLYFDHETKKFGAESSAPDRGLSDRVEQYRFAVQSGMEKYASETFTPGKYSTSTFGNDNGMITAIVSAKNLNLRNYWSGGWRSVYTVNTNQQGQTEVRAVIKLNVHYFEDGNVQLITELKKSASVDVSDPESTGQEIVGVIDTIETEFQSNLEEFYVKMHESTFKAMRRFLPVTGVKMKWKIHGHSLATEVSGF
eukprot:232413_1